MQILAERAAHVARQREEVREAEIRLMVLRRSNDLYGVDLNFVNAATVVSDLTALLGAPAAFCGLLSVRGKYITVIDLPLFLDANILGSGQRPITDARNALVVGVGQREIALLAEELLGVRDLMFADLTTIDGASDKNPVRKLGPDGIQVVDLTTLLADPRLTPDRGIA